MVQLKPFMYKPHYAPDKPYLVYSVDCDSPETTSGYIQGYWKCTHCEKGNQFRFYVNADQKSYLGKCPDCKREFTPVNDSK